jgi:hypothetical protein
MARVTALARSLDLPRSAVVCGCALALILARSPLPF